MTKYSTTAWQKCLAWLTSAAMSLTMLSGWQSIAPSVRAAETGSRILVDINKNDGRKASYSRAANNWIVDGTYTYTINGITCKLSSGGSGSVDLVNNKTLQLQDIENTPTLTMDGAKIKDGSGNPSLKLEISGLPSGTHSIRTWHACADRNVTNSTVTVKIGSDVTTGVQCPVGCKNADDAGTAYGTFTGTSVTVEVTAEGNGTLNTPWLNAFEIDGSDPFHSISRISPADQEKHAQISDGLSWTAGANAASHNVYIGTDFASVAAATTSSPEFQGNVTDTKFALDESYSSIPTYYWRVDEVSKNGAVTPGAVYSFQLAREAFPTAEGYGRYARGGRGGYVYHVTNLNDDGKEGSLRYGLETLKGARTIVFDVGGVIALKDTLCIPEDGGDVYVAGQTAPGDGITLINYDFGAMGAWDVVIRDIRVRVGDMNGSSHGGMGMSSCNHSIVDHCSISWATDEGFSSRSAANLTFQWNIIGESLNNSVHYDANDRSNVERHAFAASIGGFTGSFHHNLLINNTGRNWSLAGAMEQDGVTYGGQLDISNNVVYNWKDRTTDGGARRVQFVNNYYKAGAVSNTSLHLVSVDGNELNTSDMQMLYASGNMKVAQNGTTLIAANTDEWSSGKAVCGNKGDNANASTIRSNTPWFDNYITLDSAENAYKKVIDNTSGAGANKPALDYIDARYHKEVTEGSYSFKGSKDGLAGIIDSQNDVGGYPNSTTFKSGTAPADTDRDGMPDTWELSHGLNPDDATDGAIVSLSGDDYTNLELYLNECAGDPVAFNGSARKRSAFEQIEAEEFDAQSGIQSEDCTDVGGGQNIGYIENGDYITFRGVDFEEGAKSFTIRAAGNAAGIELYTGSMSALPAASLQFAGTGDWQNWQDVSFNIAPIKGVKTLYVRFTGGEGYLMNVNWFVFGKEAAPVNGKYALDLQVSDTDNAYDWNITGAPAVGGRVFGDRDVTFTEVPEGLTDAETILTACDSKNVEAPADVATFQAAENITVYVALDSRVENVPSWMAGYTKTDMTLASSNDVIFEVYAADFSEGETVTLGSNGQSAYCVNYLSFVTPQAAQVTTTEETTTTEAETTTETTTAQTTETETTGTDSVLYGDVDENGAVELLDVILLNKNLLGMEKLTDKGAANANVNSDALVDGSDSLLILKSLVSLVTLPVK